MKIILSCCAALSTIGAAAGAEIAEPDLDALVRDNNAFAFALHGQLHSEVGNLFYSPHSISAALAMTYAGARSDTRDEMAAALRFHLPGEKLHASFAALSEHMQAVQADYPVELHTAHSLWPQDTYPFLDSYLNRVKKYYRAEIRPMDYKNAAGEARRTINQWVENQTDNKIKDLIPPGALDALTRLVLVNAIYFKADWSHPFDEKRTETAPFYTAPDRTADIPMMRRTERFRYADDENVQVLEMPYAGDALSMRVVLPKERFGLAAVESSLTADRWDTWSGRLRRQEVNVRFPRFKMTAEFTLNAVLQALGMREAFTDEADFSGMDGQRWLFISRVIHKAFVEVNEKGTEAAAATGVIMKATAMPAPPPEFHADHPFLFFICDNQTGAILFAGRLTEPPAAE